MDETEQKYQRLREGLYHVLVEYHKLGPGYFQMNPILAEAGRRLGVRGKLADEQLLLTVWHGFFVTEQVLAWGHNLDNPGPPFVHFTPKGRRDVLGKVG